MPLVRAKKCVVLVTNALQFIKESTNILVLENGSIIEHGEFTELVSLGGAFSDMMAAHAEGLATADDARTKENPEDSLLDLTPEKKRSNSQDVSRTNTTLKKEPKKFDTVSDARSKGQLIKNEDREV